MNDLSGCMAKNNRAARAARFLVHFFLTQSVKSPREIFIFEVQTTARAHSSKYYFLWSHMKTSPAEQAKGHFAHFVKRAQHGIVANHLNDRSAILMTHFRRNSRGLNFIEDKPGNNCVQR